MKKEAKELRVGQKVLTPGFVDTIKAIKKDKNGNIIIYLTISSCTFVLSPQEKVEVYN